jgi:DNA-binding GntR family transcriptional regulator
MTSLVDHKTKTELALQVLRDRIRTGELEPGRRLRLNELTGELGMSPTPIREALRLLQADGIVDYRPHQGIVVAELSRQELDGVLRLRRLLEPFAVELAVPALTPARLRELERLHAKLLSAVASGRGSAATEANVAWHWAIYDAAGSPHLTEFIRRLWDAYPWRTMWALPGRSEQSALEHQAVMDAIAAGDAKVAAGKLAIHITSSEASLLDHLERSGEADRQPEPAPAR